MSSRVIVPWLTFAFGTGMLVLVMHAIRPLRRPPVVLIGSFFSSWLVIELPFHVLAGMGGIVALCVGWGALEHWSGWVGLLGCLGTAVGLVHLARLSLAVTDKVDAALASLPPIPNADHPLHWARLWVPTSQYQSAIVTHRNLSYGEGGGRRNQLDVYHRKDLAGPAPVVIQLHGGGWMIGHKRQQGRPILTHLAANGFVCVAANYRLSPRATFPDHIIDVKRAIAWVREHIARYGGDPNFIAVTGGSAGAHLGTLAALTPGYRPWQPGFEEADTSVDACIPIYGVYDFTNRSGFFPKNSLDRILRTLIIKQSLHDARELYEAASPIYRVGAHAPPFFAIHGRRDSLAPVEQFHEFVEVLRQTSSAPVHHLELPAAQHAFDIFPSVRVKAVLEGVRRFLDVCVRESLGGEEREGGQLGSPQPGVGVHHQADGDGV